MKKQQRRLLPMLKTIYTQILMDRQGWGILSPSHYQRILPAPLTSEQSQGYSGVDSHDLGAGRKRSLFFKMGLH